jgi:hypothetical protein
LGFHDTPFFTYWVMMDCIIMIATPAYLYLAKYLYTNVLLVQNLYTFSTIQEKRMEAMNKRD